MAEAFLTMPETKGIICVMINAMKKKMSKITSTAKSQLGALFPLILILRISCMSGRPIMETTKAAMM